MLSKQNTVATRLVPTADGVELHLERVRSVRIDRLVQGVAALLIVSLLSAVLPFEAALILQAVSCLALVALAVAALSVVRQPPRPWLLELHQGKLRQKGLAGPREHALVDLCKLVQFHDRLVLYGHDGSIASLPVPPSEPARHFLMLVRQQHAIAQETRTLTLAARAQAHALLQRGREPL